MITLHLLEYLKTIPLGVDQAGDPITTGWFWEKLPLGQNGVAIYSVGGAKPYGARGKSQIFELECREVGDDLAYSILEKIAESFTQQFAIPELPPTASSDRRYYNCRIMDVGNIQNLGFDANDQVIFKFSARIIYKKG